MKKGKRKEKRNYLAGSDYRIAAGGSCSICSFT